MRVIVLDSKTELPVFLRMQQEILADIASSKVPVTVSSFAELHDHVDANCYGGACDDDPQCPVDFNDPETVRFWDYLQGCIDAWLKEGRP